MSPNGIGLMSVKGGGAGRSKALMKGKGASLPHIAAALQSVSNVSMQLHGDDAAACLQATLTNFLKQQPTSVKVK
jgi:hypothetical protein